MKNKYLLDTTIILDFSEGHDYRSGPSLAGTLEVRHVELSQERLAPVSNELHAAFKLEGLLHLPHLGLIASHLSCHPRWDGAVMGPGCCVDHSHGTEMPTLPC